LKVLLRCTGVLVCQSITGSAIRTIEPATRGRYNPAMSLTRPEADSLRVGYVLSRFPKLTETFILYEILELQRQDVDVRIHAMVREHEDAIHPEARRLLPSVEYPNASALLRSQVEWIVRRPLEYLGLWVSAIRDNLRSPRFLIRALATVPIGADFASRMSRAKVDHVHAHWATHSALAGLVAARLLDVPFSFTAHAHDIYVNRTMLRRKLAAAAFVVTISEYNERLLHELYPDLSGKVVVVHCGVDLDELRPPAGDDRRQNDLFRVVCVASLQEQKGHRVLIDAFSQLRESGVRAELALIADGPDAPALRRQVAELGLDEVVRLVGPLARPQVLDELLRSNVMVLASVPIESGKMEGIPVALMEGMAMGLPVVATNISGIPELVADGVSGRLVPPGDVRALAGAIRELATERETSMRMGVAARAAVARSFDLRQTAGELKLLFHDAADTGFSSGRPQ
jgi:glycosyltransferase involved in cell wall biosynthesis